MTIMTDARVAVEVGTHLVSEPAHPCAGHINEIRIW
jgi:hypothetical protein